MERPAHRPTMQRWVLPLVIWLTALAAAMATAAMLSKAGVADRLAAWILLIVIPPMVAVIWVGWQLIARVKRARIERVAESLTRAGFKVSRVPTLRQKTEFSAPIAHLLAPLNLRAGAAGIEWFADRVSGPTKLLISEHEFVTGSGKTAQPHSHTVVAWPAKYPGLRDAELPQADWFIMAQHPWWIRRKIRGRELKEPEFARTARRWSLFGEPKTARRLLTPEARGQLERSPTGEMWTVGQGWICASTRRTLDKVNVDRFLAHVRAVLT